MGETIQMTYEEMNVLRQEIIVEMHKEDVENGRRILRERYRRLEIAKEGVAAAEKEIEVAEAAIMSGDYYMTRK